MSDRQFASNAEWRRALMQENERLKKRIADLEEVLQNIDANLSGSDCRQERIADSLNRAKAALAT